MKWAILFNNFTVLDNSAISFIINPSLLSEVFQLLVSVRLAMYFWFSYFPIGSPFWGSLSGLFYYLPNRTAQDWIIGILFFIIIISKIQILSVAINSGIYISGWITKINISNFLLNSSPNTSQIFQTQCV